MQAGHPCLRAPKTTQVFMNSSYRFGAISGHHSQLCCQQLRIFWEGGTETRGKASRDGRRKKIRGRTTGRKRAGANVAPFPLQPCPDPSGKGVTLPPPPLPSSRAGTCHRSLYFWHQRGETEAQALTLRTELGHPKPSTGVFSEAHHRSVWAPCIGSVFFPASPRAVDEEKPLETAPKPNLMASMSLGTLPRRWPGPKGGQRWMMLDRRASAGNAAPRNVPSSNPLCFQADIWLNPEFTPGTEQKFQQRVQIPPA